MMELIKGSIGFLDMTSWWLDELSYKERETILSVYNPIGNSSDNLIHGDVISTTEEPISLLYGIAGWLNSHEHIELCIKLYTKAKSLINANTTAINVHLLHNSEIISYHKHRLHIGLEPTITACEDQIKIADEAAHEFMLDYQEQLNFARERNIDISLDNGAVLPSHRGYKQLSIFFSNSNQYQRAIDLCRQAHMQGWSGDWDKRIERYQKKAGKVTG
ncbi:hypothetical protein [Aeromonas salmonicida]|uniref:hypothetical protein n=1 Tax=Aeromonas salmonicida TaxID=645 RepID=UPI00125EB5BD|nr:hypothetical protein [Aeromonas salmonicida]